MKLLLSLIIPLAACLPVFVLLFGCSPVEWPYQIKMVYIFAHVATTIPAIIYAGISRAKPLLRSSTLAR